MPRPVFYAAGWSLPGCLPETEPVIFERETEAWEFINEERERTNEDDREDPYVYWVDQIIPTTPYEAYRLRCEVENLDCLDPHMWVVNGCPVGPQDPGFAGCEWSE